MLTCTRARARQAPIEQVKQLSMEVLALLRSVARFNMTYGITLTGSPVYQTVVECPHPYSSLGALRRVVVPLCCVIVRWRVQAMPRGASTLCSSRPRSRGWRSSLTRAVPPTSRRTAFR